MKKILTIALALALVAAVSCASAVTITIGATPIPHMEILEFAATLLADSDIQLEIVEFNDYVQPNLQTEAGDIDANYFQHIPYMESFNADNGTHLVNAGAVHYEPMGIYAGKSNDLTAIAKGAVIAVPNDPTNEARALRLLEYLGLITLSADAGETATVLDIENNELEIEIQEVAAEQCPRILADVDFAVINSNYALTAGPSVVGDALAVESTEVSYPNIISVKEGNETKPEIVKLVEVLQSEAVVNFIHETYGTAVVPTK